MIRSFYGIVITLVVLMLFMIFHYLSFDRMRVLKSQESLVALTGLDTLALKVEWYEPKIHIFEPSINPSYPELLAIDRFSFVYGDIYGK